MHQVLEEQVVCGAYSQHAHAVSKSCVTLMHWFCLVRYIDSRAENGLTALHLAAVKGSLECVRLLLDGGASMMVRTVDLDVVSEVVAPAGSTPLHVAAMTGHVAILQAMLQVNISKPCCLSNRISS